MEAEKTYSCLPARDPEEPVLYLSLKFWVWGLRTGGADGVSPSPRAGEDKSQLSSEAGNRVRFFLLHLFFYPRHEWIWWFCTHIRERICFTGSMDSSASVSQNSLPDLPRDAWSQYLMARWVDTKLTIIIMFVKKTLRSILFFSL